MRPCVPVLLVALGCGDGVHQPPDGAAPPDGREPSDASQTVDAPVPLSWVDFTVTGCPTWEPTIPRCTGPAPLELRFAAVAPAPIESWLWLWGDGSPDDASATPQHQYALPGAYTVELRAGGPGGTASARKEMLVSVVPAAVGARCRERNQCAAGLDCRCVDDPRCPPSLRQGVCTRACSVVDTCDDGTCVDTGLGDAPWRGSICLASCSVDGDCAAGLSCRELGAAGGGWTAACFAPGAEALADVGASCVRPDGLFDDAACASGTCEAMGARGLCVDSCSATDPCPSYAACADMTAVGPVCLARCASRPCVSDPWLACEAPDASGDLGFTLDEPADPLGYCAPRRCEQAEDCGIDGACVDSGGASFCRSP